jgi:hypothetical protein
MKIVELTNKVLLPLNNEENSLLEKFESTSIAKSQLSEREQVIANQLTVKDVLVRTNEEGKIHYKKVKSN